MKCCCPGMFRPKRSRVAQDDARLSPVPSSTATSLQGFSGNPQASGQYGTQGGGKPFSGAASSGFGSSGAASSTSSSSKRSPKHPEPSAPKDVTLMSAPSEHMLQHERMQVDNGLPVIQDPSSKHPEPSAPPSEHMLQNERTHVDNGLQVIQEAPPSYEGATRYQKKLGVRPLTDYETRAMSFRGFPQNSVMICRRDGNNGSYLFAAVCYNHYYLDITLEFEDLDRTLESLEKKIKRGVMNYGTRQMIDENQAVETASFSYYFPDEKAFMDLSSGTPREVPRVDLEQERRARSESRINKARMEAKNDDPNPIMTRYFHKKSEWYETNIKGAHKPGTVFLLSGEDNGTVVVLSDGRRRTFDYPSQIEDKSLTEICGYVFGQISERELNCDLVFYSPEEKRIVEFDHPCTRREVRPEPVEKVSERKYRELVRKEASIRQSRASNITIHPSLFVPESKKDMAIPENGLLLYMRGTLGGNVPYAKYKKNGEVITVGLYDCCMKKTGYNEWKPSVTLNAIADRIEDEENDQKSIRAGKDWTSIEKIRLYVPTEGGFSDYSHARKSSSTFV